jgi:hypothetical protein
MNPELILRGIVGLRDDCRRDLEQAHKSEFQPFVSSRNIRIYARDR